MEDLGVPECIAKRVCRLTGKFPKERVSAADEMLITAYLAGAGIPELADLAAQITARVMPPDEDDAEEPSGNVRLESTIDGAAVITGELEPAAAAVVQAAFEQFGARQGTG